MHKRLLSTSASRSLLLRQPCAACGNCVIAAVTWSDVCINHCCCAFYHSHSTFRILPIALYDQGGSGNSPTKLLRRPAKSTDLTLSQQFYATYHTWSAIFSNLFTTASFWDMLLILQIRKNRQNKKETRICFVYLPLHRILLCRSQLGQCKLINFTYCRIWGTTYYRTLSGVLPRVLLARMKLPVKTTHNWHKSVPRMYCCSFMTQPTVSRLHT